MYSIQQFQAEGVKNLEKVSFNYSLDMIKIAEMVKGVKDSMINMGLFMIAEELEMYDGFLRKNRHVQSDMWNVKMKQHFLPVLEV